MSAINRSAEPDADTVTHPHTDAHGFTDFPTYEHLHSHSHPHHSYPADTRSQLVSPFSHIHNHTHSRGTSLLRGPAPTTRGVAADRGATIVARELKKPLMSEETAEKYILGEQRSPTDLTAELIDGELRVTNPVTGGQKGAKDSQLSAAPAEAMMVLGRVFGFGGRKYARHNYRKGYAWSLSYDAMLRHIHASLAGEDYDPESGLPHMAHAAWHALTLTQFLIDQRMERHPKELDDRFNVEECPSC